MNDDTKDLWSLPDPKHVLECIEKWRSLDLRKMTDSEIDKELSSFLDLLVTFPLSSTNRNLFKLWRIREVEYLIKEESECWEPPKNKTRMNRCNAEGHPVLYASEKLKTPFEELFIEPYKQVYAIKYRQKKNLNLSEIVPKNLVPTDQNNNPIYDELSLVSYQILREFVRSEFLKPVGKDTEYLYRISGSMCRVWFDEADIDGWLYPSVQSINDINVATKSESARENLEIEDIRIVKMVDKDKVINSGIISDNFLPIFNLMKMVIQSDFKGEIKEGKIHWQPSDDFGGDY